MVGSDFEVPYIDCGVNDKIVRIFAYCVRNCSPITLNQFLPVSPLHSEVSATKDEARTIKID